MAKCKRRDETMVTAYTTEQCVQHARSEVLRNEIATMKEYIKKEPHSLLEQLDFVLSALSDPCLFSRYRDQLVKSYCNSHLYKALIIENYTLTSIYVLSEMERNLKRLLELIQQEWSPEGSLVTQKQFERATRKVLSREGIAV